MASAHHRNGSWAARINTKWLVFSSDIGNVKVGLGKEVVTLSVRSQLARFINSAKKDFRLSNS